MDRAELLEQVASIISEIDLSHPIRVAIDGIDGAGKTTLADELMSPVERQGRRVIRASVDGFHNPRAIRYWRGWHSPEGYFRDSFNYEAVIDNLLQPLGSGGSRQYRTAVFDYKTDSPVVSPLLQCDDHAILLFDGIFLLRPELVNFWDLTIFLDVTFEVGMARCSQRGGGSINPAPIENRRYVEGQKIYLAECDPKAVADLIIDNNDLSAPHFKLLRGRS